MNEPVIPVAVFSNKDDNRPVRHDLSWSSLAQRLCQYDERLAKDGRAWSPVTYRPGTTRGKENVEQVYALVLDIDHAELPTDLLNGLEYVAHTTFSHALDDPRWRVVLPLTRPVEGEDWPNFWLRANAYFGGCVDPQTKDRSRIFYLPSCRPGALHEAKQQHGLLLDPSSLPDVPQYEPAAWTSRRNGSIHTVPVDTLAAWAAQFASAKVDELAGMLPNTGRNAACNRAAYLLAGLVADGRHDLHQSWVEQQLYSACEQNNLVFEDGERSVRATISSGFNAGLSRPWSPADQDDDWKPSPRLSIPSAEQVQAINAGQSFWMSLGDLVRTAPDPGRQLVEGVIWEARTHWIYSSPGAGKTLFILAALMHMAAGRPFCGRPVVQGPVCIIEEDSPNSVISEYVQMLADIYEFDLDTLPLWINKIRGNRITDDQGRRTVRTLIDKAPEKPLVVALDACERIVPSDRFNSRELEPLSQLFQSLLADGIANVMIDHTRKPGGSEDKPDPIDLLYGGRTKSAISDVMLFFSGAIKSQAHVSFPKFRGEEPASFVITFDGSVGFTIKQGKAKVSETERIVMRVITNAYGRLLSVSDVAEEAHLSDKTAQRSLVRLVDIGWVEREGTTRWTRYRAAQEAQGPFA